MVDLTCKDVIFNFGDKEKASFETLKAAFTTALSRPVLNQSFLGDLGVRVQSGVKTGVLCSRDRAFPKVGKAD